MGSFEKWRICNEIDIHISDRKSPYRDTPSLMHQYP